MGSESVNDEIAEKNLRNEKWESMSQENTNGTVGDCNQAGLDTIQNETESSNDLSGPVAEVEELFDQAIESIQQYPNEMQNVIQNNMGQVIMMQLYTTKNDMVKLYNENEALRRTIAHRKETLLKLSGFCSDSATGVGQECN